MDISRERESPRSTHTRKKLVINDPNLVLTVQSNGIELSFQLRDSSGRTALYRLKEKGVTLGEAHSIGRQIEQDFNRSNGTIMELADVSRVIGMVYRSISKFQIQDVK